MTLFEKAKQLGLGISHLRDWLGDGGQVVEQATAQSRADTCKTCGLNQPASSVTTAVALAIRGQLGVKNKLKLRVEGEKRLGNCMACGCVLRLLVWEPQERIEFQTTDEERMKLPNMCWKISKR